MVVFCSTEAAQTRGMLIRGKGHFCLPQPEPILCGEEEQGADSRELSELFAFTLAHPDQSPGMRSLCDALYRPSPSNKTWSMRG